MDMDRHDPIENKQRTANIGAKQDAEFLCSNILNHNSNEKF